MKVFIFTLGCRSNQYESDSLANMLEKRGHKIVSLIGEADICIVNTCTVTHRADYDSRRILRRIIKENPNAICVATGCYVQVGYKKLGQIKGIDYLIGNRQKPHLPEMFSIFKKQKRPQVLISSNPTSLETLVCFYPSASSKHTRAYLKIQDGCDTFCSYCIVPYARGRCRSLPPREVIKRILYLQSQGVKEVVLTGIHLGEYGKDLSPALSLVCLLKEIKRIRPSLRIRLSSLNPDEINDELIGIFSDFKNLCPHLHISLQSGSDQILKRMRRPYNVARFKKVINKISSLNGLPFAIGVDIIVGFPGETEEDFKSTYELIRQSPISYCHVFSYSDRPGTRASQYQEKVNHEIIKERTKRLKLLDKKKRRAFIKANLGYVHHVLLEQRKNDFFIGHTSNYISVLIQDKFHSLSPNQIVSVKLTEIKEDKAYGEICD